MRVDAEFVTSAAGATDLPTGSVSEVALVGRSNVGKSSLINALTGRRLARTSAAPGKTQLANIYRATRGGRRLLLVDLPGYGYARGGSATARGFEKLMHAYFDGRLRPRRAEDERTLAALLLVDARHPGLDSDLEAWAWLRERVAEAAIVATKIDKLARGERIRALDQLESVFEDSVLPVSAVTGEGLDELWKLIDKLANSNKGRPRPRHSLDSRPPAATGPRPARAPRRKK